MKRTRQVPRLRALILVGLSAVTVGCRSTAGRDSAAADGQDSNAADRAPIETMLVALYDAFCFEAGEEADWDGMRALFAPGASFYAPIRAGRTPVGEDADEFIAGFRDWIVSSPIGESGLHERITHWQIVRCGTIAHAFVTFDGVLPDGTPYSQGVDALQLVQDGERWLLASFTSQYASPDAPLPGRFVDPRSAR